LIYGIDQRADRNNGDRALFGWQPHIPTMPGEDGSVLYITASNAIYRIRLRTKGAGF
jgi:hypothetical protein